MLTLHDIGLAFPPKRETLDEIAAPLELNRNQTRMFGRFFGFDSFACDDQQPIQAMVQAAAEDVLTRNRETEQRLSHVIHCHTLLNTDRFDGQTSDILAPYREQGIEVFSAKMNHCATSISMLDTLDKLLGEDEAGLILVGEKAFHPAIRVIENTTIMGEAGAAILVSRKAGPYELEGTYVSHHGQFAINTGRRGENYLEGFEDAYLDFACATLTKALAAFECDFDAISAIMPHNVNLASWYQIAQKLGFDAGKLQLGTIGECGHCFGADPFINLMKSKQTGSLSSGDRVLLVSIGLGATASCALVRVR